MPMGKLLRLKDFRITNKRREALMTNLSKRGKKARNKPYDIYATPKGREIVRNAIKKRIKQRKDISKLMKNSPHLTRELLNKVGFHPILEFVDTVGSAYKVGKFFEEVGSGSEVGKYLIETGDSSGVFVKALRPDVSGEFVKELGPYVSGELITQVGPKIVSELLKNLPVQIFVLALRKVRLRQTIKILKESPTPKDAARIFRDIVKRL